MLLAVTSVLAMLTRPLWVKRNTSLPPPVMTPSLTVVLQNHGRRLRSLQARTNLIKKKECTRQEHGTLVPSVSLTYNALSVNFQ
jgi:hypothetical protein